MRVPTFKKLAVFYVFNYNIQTHKSQPTLSHLFLPVCYLTIQLQPSAAKVLKWRSGKALPFVGCKRRKMKKNKNREGNTATAARPHWDTNQLHVFVCLYRIPQCTFTPTAPSSLLPSAPTPSNPAPLSGTGRTSTRCKNSRTWSMTQLLLGSSDWLWQAHTHVSSLMIFVSIKVSSCLWQTHTGMWCRGSGSGGGKRQMDKDVNGMGSLDGGTGKGLIVEWWGT